MVPARAVAGGLHVEPVVHAVDDDLRLALRLHVAAHDAERKPGHAVSGGEAGDDGLEGAFAGRVDVGVAVLQGEKFAAILEHEAKAVGYQTRTHAAKVRLNDGNHHAVLVGGAEVRGIAVAWSLAWINRLHDAVEADELRALLRVVFRVKPVDGNFCKVRIGVEAGAIFIGQPLGFDLHVQRLRGLEAELAQIELLDNVEHLQGCEALRIGAHGIDIHAAVVADERLVPLGTMLAEILRREPATDALEIGVDGFGNGAVVKVSRPPSAIMR